MIKCVGVGAALEKKFEGGHAGKHTDGVAPHAGAVLGAGQVEGRAPAPPPHPHAHKVVHRLLHLEYLKS